MSWNQPGESRYGVHSIDHFALEVPSLEVATHFFDHFGLEVEPVGQSALALRAKNDPHVWARLHAGASKRMAYLSLNCYAEEFAALREQLIANGARAAAADVAHVTAEGFWFHDPDGNLLQVKPGVKTMPDHGTSTDSRATADGDRGVLGRDRAPKVHPRRLSHVLLFTSDIERSIGFFHDALGLRLSDRSEGAVAFMHARHGCDHHLVAFASSHARGWHHSSWDVVGIDEVGQGAEQMRDAGYTEGWGTGRHVLGSNFFHYVRDPWGSFAEYSSDIDYVPLGTVWPAGNYHPKDSLYLWGPAVPENFIHNSEA